jgi:regulatory protein
MIAENEAYSRLARQCSMGEQCIYDARKKMQRWEIEDDAQQRIVKRLLEERFIDENRYAHAFVRDKSRYNRWGSTKIKFELKRRGISERDIEDALCEIDEEESLSTLRDLLESKRRTVKGRSEYEIKAKLVRFALSRGFSIQDAMRVVGMED